MFNSGFRGKRASDNTGTVASQTQFIQQKYPQPSISGYSIQGTDDTALDPAGGQTVLVNGTGFASGAAVTVNGQTISPVTVISPTQLSFTSIALAGGSYSLIVYNSTGGAAILVPGLIYSAVPTWTTSAGSIGTTYETTPINTSVVATSDSAITYSLASGSLPSGATLYANGVITGTSPVESGSTTYTFAIKAEDQELQDTTRTFTLTINTDVVTWVSPADGTTYTANINEVAGNVVLSATSAAGYNVSYAANTLPTGLTLTGNTISGTPTIVGNSATLLTATAATTNRNATRTINWVIQLGSDPYFYATSLLLNGETSSNYWIQDSSPNNYALTVFGDTKSVAFSPYNTGYSVYFDGNGDYFTVPGNAAFQFPGDLTIEAWIIWDGTESSGGREIYATGGSGSLDQWGIFSGAIYFAGIASTSSPPTNRWVHLAVTRSGSTVRHFINGVTSGSGTVSSTIGSGSTLYIGIRGDGFHPWFGYISNFRIVKGTALYTSDFTPPTSPLTAIANTSLLVCASSRFVDKSANNFAITLFGDVKIVANSPFVETDTTTGSGYFDGNVDYLTSPTSFNTSNNWTVEAWCYFTGSANNDPLFVGNPERLYLVWLGPTFYLGDSSSNNIVVNNKPINRWFHVAAVKNSSTYTVYIDGVSAGTSTSALITDTLTSWWIGARTSQSQYATGYISNFRAVNGTAVYTSNFTPPTTPLTAISGTTLLTLQNRLGENSKRFIDTSNFKSVVSPFANATQGTFSPFSQTGWSGYFTGSSTSYISTPSTTLLNQGQTYTVQCWIYPTAFTTSTSAVRRMYIFVKGVIYAGLSIHSDGTLGWYGWPTPAGMIVTSAAGTITTNVWQHVALVVNPGNYIKLFKNGAEVGTAGYTAAGSDGSAIQIGHGDTGQGTDGFIGYISNFKITLSALTGGQLDYSATPTISSSVNSSLLVLQTNRFNDTSGSNLVITAAAGASIQSFSPFAPSINTPTSYSGYFDGTGDYLTAPAGASVSGTGIFTLEFWMYSPTIASGYRVLSAAVSGGFSLTVNSTGTLGYGRALISTDGTTTGTINFNQWNHIAAVRNGTGAGQFVIYINGTSAGSFTNSTNYTSGTVYIGIDGNGTDFAFTGYISNYRIVIGTAVYTSNFTPSTIPLTAIANTSLLTLQSNRLIDNSTNNFTITSFGNSTATQFNPFGITSSTGTNSAYSVANVGGSMYFDGNGDYLAVTHNSDAFNCGTGNFTIEFWYYDDGNSVLYPNIISSTDWATGTGGVGLRYNNTGQANKFSFFWYGVGDPWLTTPGTFAGKQWNHVALTRSSNTFTLWVNGVSQATNTNGGTINWGLTSGGPKVGGGNWDGGNSWTKGYISNLRLIKGVALYTSGFTPSSAPLTAIQNTTLLLNGTNGGIIDYAGKTDLETVGNAQLSASVKKFGSSSMYFDGSGDFVQLFTSNQTLSFRTGNFTVECWVYFNTSGQHGICQISTNPGGFNASTANSIAFQRNATGSWEIYAKNTSTGQAATINQNQWYHVALVRSGTTTTFYVNGTSLITVSADTTDYTGTYIGLGAIYSTVVPLNGYIDDFRVTTGIARYTTNFTPPTQPFITF